MAKKIRADQAMLDQDLLDDLKEAQALIMAGRVYTVKESQVPTPGYQVKEGTQLYIKSPDHPYVSRGGLKLKQAIDSFDLDFEGKIILDIGSSTGGFTDVALRHGAGLVYALDVGTNQLVWSLRQDDRVIVMEQTNFKDCKLSDFRAGQPDLAVMDVSFISLYPILENLAQILPPGHLAVALIKPQFEADKEDVQPGGLVLDPGVHRKVLEAATAFMTKLHYCLLGLLASPIKGGKGNIEFIALLRNASDQDQEIQPMIDQAIDQSLDL